MDKSYDNSIFLGIDVHKKTYSISAVQHGSVVRRARMEAEPASVIAFCKKYFANSQIRCAYEAGFCGFHIHRSLTAAGIDNVVVHRASIEVAAGNRIKTDKRDSLKIASHLAAGRLKSIFIPSVEQESNRAVSRLREEFVRARSRVANQIKSHLYLLGLIPIDSQSRVSKPWLKEVSKLKCSAEDRFCLMMCTRLWLDLSDSIKRIEERLDAQRTREKSLSTIYLSFPGVGPIAASILMNELGDMSHFANEDRLFSYCGLTPSEHSSGEHQRLGHISRQGKALLRKILIQSAWVAIKHDASLESVFLRISKSGGSRKAIVAVARKLIGRIRCCLKENRPYVYVK